MVEFSQVRSGDVGVVWSALSEMIEKGLSKGQGDGTTPDHMKAAVIRGDMLMWAITESDEIISCLVLSVRKTDTMTKVFVELLAGKSMDLWGDQVERLLLDFGKLTGAKCTEASCRLGLARYLKKRGWREKAVIMELT